MDKIKKIKKKIGTFGVDSGSFMIGDPSNFIGDSNEKTPCQESYPSWLDFCKAHWINDKMTNSQMKYAKGLDGLGVVCNTKYGDGTYSVTGYFSSEENLQANRPDKIVINFE